MSSKSRRKILLGVASGICVGLSGCMSFDIGDSKNQVDLAIVNTSQKSHSIKIEVKYDDGETETKQSLYINSSQTKIKKENFFIGKQFSIIAKVDEARERKMDYYQSNCKNEQIFIHIREDGRIRMKQSTCQSN